MTNIHSKNVNKFQITLSTGGDDLSYALGLSLSLSKCGVLIDFLGSNTVDAPELHEDENIRFLNMRRDQSEEAPLLVKVRRILHFYLQLIHYILITKPRIFHILWNNRFEYFDRTILSAVYKLRGHKLVLTAHNINKARRDGNDTFLNRVTLRLQYWLADHIFVHTERMAAELQQNFGVPDAKVTTIPFGLNETNPQTDLSRAEARRRVGVDEENHVLLFFGQIAPYKGLEYLVEVVPVLSQSYPLVRIVIAGKVKKGADDYWLSIQDRIAQLRIERYFVNHIRFIPNEDVERYFKAADALVLPYVDIFQSGLPFLAYSFGLPVIATDVGALAEEIEIGETGFICQSRDSASLTAAVFQFLESALFRELETRRPRIISWARKRHSWDKVAEMTQDVYRKISLHEQLM